MIHYSFFGLHKSVNEGFGGNSKQQCLEQCFQNMQG